MTLQATIGRVTTAGLLLSGTLFATSAFSQSSQQNQSTRPSRATTQMRQCERLSGTEREECERAYRGEATMDEPRFGTGEAAGEPDRDSQSTSQPQSPSGADSSGSFDRSSSPSNRSMQPQGNRSQSIRSQSDRKRLSRRDQDVSYGARPSSSEETDRHSDRELNRDRNMQRDRQDWDRKDTDTDSSDGSRSTSDPAIPESESDSQSDALGRPNAPIDTTPDPSMTPHSSESGITNSNDDSGMSPPPR